MAQTPSIPKGTRDFGPEQMARRNYIFSTIEQVYKSYGFAQIETPAMENLSTLLGKYGDEGDKLLFRILNSGDAFANVDPSRPLASQVCEKGLRYDLTVPFARFVVQHQNDIVFPFKRYQIQPVWRADRPQKGRYREFYQCDADVIGSRSQVSECELVQIVDKVFERLGIRVLMKINNRKILAALAQVCGFPDKMVDITVAIDKIDKIGLEAVKEEMLAHGLTPEAVAVIEPVLTLSGTPAQKIARMREVLATSEIGLLGCDELEELFGLIDACGIGCDVEIDLSLARGLNYYTGAIFEVKALDYEIGSICGGGRYDNLTGIFGLPGVSGVGISFGADRIYDVLTGLDKFPASLSVGTRLLFAPMDVESRKYSLRIAGKLRESGISCEVYPDICKLKKMFDYADRKHIPFISILGGDEVAASTVNIKNLAQGCQESFSCTDLAGIEEFLNS